MRIGIVGAEAAKFTPATEQLAREAIRRLLTGSPVEQVISGHCHLGGIDIWAIEEAERLNIPTMEYPPKVLKWEGGYKQRNFQIATASDVVVCITVRELPEGYTGMRFAGCYHHRDESNVQPHIKSGGCWTTRQARLMGKPTELIVIGENQ